MQAKHRVFLAYSTAAHQPAGAGGGADSLGDHHTLPALHLPLASYRFPLRGSPWRDALIDLKPDLIEAGDPYVTAWAALDAGQRLGVPVVGFYHSDLPRLMGDRFGRYVEKRLTHYVTTLYSQFDSVLAPCNAWRID
ncbi:glycosyltransferase [Halomonas sp. PA16-9]|uniref:glycosyltransferase n=1 Tax=Halomonas sp. PA16-9 TaxID=2576841 RepID=UPI0030EC31CB